MKVVATLATLFSSRKLIVEFTSNNIRLPRKSSKFGGIPYKYIYLYNILGWSSFPSIRPIIIRPSKFLIPEEEDDGTGGGRRLMVAATVYPHVLCGESCRGEKWVN
jgi:hypothetical protein